MKLTTRILVCLFLIMIAGLLSSNIILKKQYDAIDKEDVYWTYNKILEQPFKHLHITGGNNTHIFYEPSNKPSVRLLQEWVTYHHGEVKADVRNDTLFLNFDYQPANLYEKFYLQNATPVRIFSSQLLSVTGNNINFEMLKANQKSITVNLAGKSKFEIESMYSDLDSVNVYQSDSSAVLFEMSPEYKKIQNDNLPARKGKIEFHNTKGVLVEYKSQQQNNFDENMSIRSVHAIVQGHSILDVGHAQIQKLRISVSDSSAVVLSGNALKLMSQK